MKIYILSINEIAKTQEIIYSSYISPRHLKKVEYYASKQGAEKRREDIYQGIHKLVGSIDNIEVVIKEQEVQE